MIRPTAGPRRPAPGQERERLGPRSPRITAPGEPSRTPTTRPPPARTAVTARRRSSRFSGTLVRDRAPVFCRRSPVPVLPVAPRSAPRSGDVRRRLALLDRAAVPLAMARGPVRCPCDRRPLADLARACRPDLARLAGRAFAHPPRTGGTPIRQRHRPVRGSRAEPGAGGGQAPPEVAGNGTEAFEAYPQQQTPLRQREKKIMRVRAACAPLASAVEQSPADDARPAVPGADMWSSLSRGGPDIPLPIHSVILTQRWRGYPNRRG